MSHIIKRLLLMFAVFFSAGILYSAPAAAQATRTWISGVGDDVNPCSRTAPCKTFAGAIAKTAAGGEINCIDPGGFGAVTITKSITLDCEDVEAGVLVVGSPGITVNAAATDTIVIRGLDIFGVAPNNPGTYGVHVVNAKAVIIENTTIKGFSRGVSLDSNATNISLYVNNSSIQNNGVGVSITPNSGTAVALTLDGAKIQNAFSTVPGAPAGAGSGVYFSTQGVTATITAKIYHSQISGGTDANPTVIGINAKIPTGTFDMTVDSSMITDNSGLGIRVTGGTTRVGNTVISGNGTGVSATAGQLISRGNNNLGGNGTDGTFTSTVPLN